VAFAKAAEDRIERICLAKAEVEAVKAAEAAGEPRPPTPNLDAIKEGPPAKVVKPRAERSERYLAALATKKAGARGKGLKVSEDELVAYVRGVREANPAAVQNQELEVAYWLERFAVSRSRWVAAWADAGRPQEVVAS
jgi:hypothetical protein